MSNKIYYSEKNGDTTIKLWYAYCPICGGYIHESHPSEIDNYGNVICMDCAYIYGYITEKQYIKKACCWNNFIKRAVIHEGKIYLTNNSKLPWKKTQNDIRNSPIGKQWRKKVFERDNYKCAICGQVGGELNAHHIKPFSKFPELRFEVDNGITLCKKCHQQVHKEKNSEWLHT